MKPEKNGARKGGAFKRRTRAYCDVLDALRALAVERQTPDEKRHRKRAVHLRFVKTGEREAVSA